MGIPIVALKINSASGVIDVPVYSLTDVDVVDKSFRINTKNGIGCFDLVLPTITTPFRVMTNDGIKGINMESIAVYDPIVEDFMDATYNFDFVYGSPYTFTRFDGIAPNGNSGYMKSTNQNVSATECTISTNLVVPIGTVGRVEIDYYVDSEPNYDYLKFFINEVEVAKYAGVAISGTLTIPNLAHGTHVLKIVYFKDNAANENTDTAYLSEMRFYRV